MRNALLAGASAIAIMLGGCSWIDSHMPGSSSDQQSSAQTSGSGTSQNSVAQNTQPSTRMDSDTSAIPPSNMGSSSNTGSTSDKSMHHSMAKSHMGSDRVKQAQQKLKDDGEYQGQVDGKLGPKTAEAVKQYQQKNGLKQTGRLDRETMGKLGVNSTTGSGSSAPAADSSNSSAPAASPNSSAVPPTTSNPPASQTPAH